MGLHPDRFWRLTWDEFEGLKRNHIKKLQEQWYHTRQIVATIFNSRMGIKDSDMVSPSDIIELPGDKGVHHVFADMTEEDIAKRMQGLETLFERLIPYN